MNLARPFDGRPVIGSLSRAWPAPCRKSCRNFLEDGRSVGSRTIQPKLFVTSYSWTSLFRSPALATEAHGPASTGRAARETVVRISTPAANGFRSVPAARTVSRASRTRIARLDIVRTACARARPPVHRATTGRCARRRSATATLTSTPSTRSTTFYRPARVGKATLACRGERSVRRTPSAAPGTAPAAASRDSRFTILAPASAARSRPTPSAARTTNARRGVVWARLARGCLVALPATRARSACLSGAKRARADARRAMPTTASRA